MWENDKQLINYNLRFNNKMLKSWELEPVCSALSYKEFPLLHCMSMSSTNFSTQDFRYFRYFIYLAHLEWHILALHAMSFPFPYYHLYAYGILILMGLPAMMWSYMGSYSTPYAPSNAISPQFLLRCRWSRDTCCFTASQRQAVQELSRLDFLFES